MDKAVRRQGQGSLRMEHFQDASQGMVRVMEPLTLKPWHQYRLTVYLRTQGVDQPGSIQVLVKDPAGAELAWPHPTVQGDQDWTQVETVFPSLANTRATIFYGVWGGGRGKAWWADATLEDAGLVNLLRRPTCPLQVQGDQVYQEGRDFEPFSDPALGNQPWPGAYSFHQPSPELRLTPGTRIRKGERLLLSGYVAKVIGAGQVAACLGEEDFFRLYAREAALQTRALHPSGFLLGHDEIRTLGQDPPCSAQPGGPAGVLARNLTRCAALLRQTNPKATLYLWSDMVNPNQNAHAGYYLCAGDLTGSWQALPRNLVILNWDWLKPRPSAAFFASLGLHQILAGYYDRDPRTIADWLDQVQGLKGVEGVMYTTWENRYEDLEAFAKAAWGGRSASTLKNARLSRPTASSQSKCQARERSPSWRRSNSKLSE